jgi:hypothetical protein
MLFLAFARGLIAAKKSDICIPESSNCIKSAGVMPCPCAISNNSARAHSISSGLGSAGCRLLFIVYLYNRHAFWLGRVISIPFSRIVAGSFTAVCTKLHTKLSGCPEESSHAQHSFGTLFGHHNGPPFCDRCPCEFPLCKIDQRQILAGGSIIALPFCSYRNLSWDGGEELPLVRILQGCGSGNRLDG